MNIIEDIRCTLASHGDPERARHHVHFFKAMPGGYGEGDQFIGIRVPAQRKIAKEFHQLLSLDDIAVLLQSPIHEHRLTALFMLVNRFGKAEGELEKKAIVDVYLDKLDWVNNWDLVDSSAHLILGAYLLDKEKDILYGLAASPNLWKQRVAVIATLFFIRNKAYEDTLKLARMLLCHEHDLIHKAVGWMLREVGKRDFPVEYAFLKTHYRMMPRTMLRYAIERFDEGLRQRFLQGLE